MGVRGNRRVVVGQVARGAAADVYVSDVHRGGRIRGRHRTCKQRRTWRRREMPCGRRPRMYQMRMRVQTVAAYSGPGIAARVAANHRRHRRHRQLIVVLLLLLLLPIGSSSAKITVVMVLLLMLLVLLVLLLLVVGRGRVVFPRGRNRFRLDLHRREGGGRGGWGAVGDGQVGQTATEKDSRVLP